MPTTAGRDGQSGVRHGGALERRRLIANHGLQPGHTYRLQFMVHDGDQNKTGGDVGQACVNVDIPDCAIGASGPSLSDGGEDGIEGVAGKPVAPSPLEEPGATRCTGWPSASIVRHCGIC